MAIKRNRGEKEQVPGTIPDDDSAWLAAAGVDVTEAQRQWAACANPQAKSALADRLMGEMGIARKVEAHARRLLERVM